MNRGKCAKVGDEMKSATGFSPFSPFSRVSLSPPIRHSGTLTYQLTDPRTAAEFAPCWDKAKNSEPRCRFLIIWPEFQ